jgi:23S rRNA (adenine2030-N6)-methyltransferase
MFSYRHAFHAGNHADVIKHAIFVHVLQYMGRKETPYWVIDTHAGAGIYDLRSDWAAQNSEFDTGLDRLLSARQAPELVEQYLLAVQHVNTDGFANFYPGSPWLALWAMRKQDRLRLFEKHPAEIEVLANNLASMPRAMQKQVAVYDKDGFTGLRALLPPPPRRGVIIIDPSYEDKADYRRTANAVTEGLKRFATGCFIVWYPLAQRLECRQLARSLEHLAGVDWLHASLTVHKPRADGYGLHGSGVFVVNPPWTLKAALDDALPWLARTLAQDDHARFSVTSSAT